MDRARAERTLRTMIGHIKGEMKDRSWAVIAISDADLEALIYAEDMLKEDNTACDRPGGGQDNDEL